MPPSSRYSRTSSRSPTRSTSFTSTSTGQQRTQIVKRLTLTGKAQRKTDGDLDGAAIRMYIRMAVPANGVAPGDTIPLFPEENLKILDSVVHPLDSSFAPYNFSPTNFTALTKAMRILNLPPRLRESYLSLFGESSATSSPASSTKSPYDKKYSGEIGVSGYNVSYVLPNVFPPRVYESDNFSKRLSNEMHFMAVVDLWIPYLSMPPYSPYLLAIPVPRCLSNQIRLRIFPPKSPSISSSLASLSSAEGDTTSWDLTADPPVTRNGGKRLTRNNSYNSFADDESSDSSASTADGYGVQGSFPSTDRIRIRWATPMKAEEVPETSDGRRRVGIRDVKSDMTCSVLRRDKGKVRGRRDATESGVVMKVEYTATCRNVWFPGVATMLGMDVALDAGDCDVSWAPDEEGKWTVSGGAGFTGFAVGPPPVPSSSRQPSADAPPIRVSPSSPRKQIDHTAPTRLASTDSSSLSTASLLRAPLPESPNPGEVSFDESPSDTPLSSIASLATMPSDPERDRRSRALSAGRDSRHMDTEPEDDRDERPPKVPITIHLNMNELGPPSQNEFTFSVSGTIILKSRENNAMFSASPISSGSTASDDENELSAVMPIPQFHVLYTDRETISTIVLNESDSTSLDVYNSTGNITDAQSRKTVLQPGGKTKCGSDGGRLALRKLSSNRPFLRREASTESIRRPPSRPRTPSYIPRNASTASFYRERQSFSIMVSKPKRDGPLMIPSVSATITPLAPQNGSLPTEYAVCVSLPAPSEADSEWLEFGLAQAPKSGMTKPKTVGPTLERHPPQVEVASASVEGVPVLFETSAAVKPDSKLPALGLTFEETSAKEWITWVKIHVGDAGGGNVQVVYLVKADQVTALAPELNSWKKLTGKGKSKEEMNWDVLLPTFSLPVGAMEVKIESQPEVEYAVKSNLTHQQATSNGLRLLQYSLEEFFYPNLTVTMTSSTPSSSRIASTGWRILGLILCMMPTVIALLAMADKQLIGAELSKAHQSLESCSMALQSSANIPDPATITLTTTATAMTTIYTSSSVQAKWNTRDSVSEPDTKKTTVTGTASHYLPPSITSILTFVDPSSSASSSTSSTETQVSDVHDMPFLWPIRLDIPSLEIPEVARVTAIKIWQGVGMAWYLFQRLLHYPLDPP